MSITTDKSIYTIYPGEVVPVKYTVTNDWNAKFGDAFTNRYRIQLVSSYYNNGDRIDFNPYDLQPGYTQTGTIKLNTPSTEQKYSVELRQRIQRASDGKFLTDDKTTFYIETKIDSPDEPDEPDEPDDSGFGFGRAEITQTNIGPGIVFNVGSNIDYSLRVMNTGSTNKIYGVIGLGYHDKDGNVFFTGRYAKEQAQVSSGEMITWNANIEVLHKDYTAREMTPRGPAVYFMAGHEENGKIVWDRSEYLPVELILESGYVDPLDPDGVPDDWPEPIYDDSSPWDDFWDIITPEPTPEPGEEPIDIMPFLYIGFAGLIGYLLIKGG